LVGAAGLLDFGSTDFGSTGFVVSAGVGVLSESVSDWAGSTGFVAFSAKLVDAETSGVVFFIGDWGCGLSNGNGSVSKSGARGIGCSDGDTGAVGVGGVDAAAGGGGGGIGVGVELGMGADAPGGIGSDPPWLLVPGGGGGDGIGADGAVTLGLGTTSVLVPVVVPGATSLKSPIRCC